MSSFAALAMASKPETLNSLMATNTPIFREGENAT